MCGKDSVGKKHIEMTYFNPFISLMRKPRPTEERFVQRIEESLLQMQLNPHFSVLHYDMQLGLFQTLH